MGIPKFYRYISERWPTISNLVNGNIIPEFDNLYLDMNAIIHNCTHTNDGDVTYRMTEAEMMIAIFNYIDHLFTVIKPKKIFYMAIDGVAPRAKMNQQRARRFKSAKEAEEARLEAIRNGVELPKEAPFDSNCITPGTEFMANLTVHLNYFINRKVTEDASWRGIDIILSGHEVPGEGEHKIMNYLRTLRSEPDFDQNTRHCLYGLDADLIMLGLSSHEPHFSLLREEVVFGRAAAQQSNELSEKRFFLLHLSLVREYMQMEFKDVLDEGFDFERILDDFILINFFVGNDFLPEIPMLLINDGALPIIFRTYTQYLLQVGDYVTLNGVINFANLKQWLKKLSVHQTQKFEEQALDAEWFNNELGELSLDDKMNLTQHQKDLVREIKPFILGCATTENLDEARYELSPTLSQQDLNFLGVIAEQTKMRICEEKQPDESIKCELIADTAVFPVAEQDRHLWLKETRQIFKVYEKAKLVDERLKQEELYSQKLVKWRNSYYKRKFGVTQENEKVKEVSKNYLEGLQWVLSYYYRGCPSWAWYFRDHYAPMTSDLFDAIDNNLKIEFGPSTPFKPFEQLMGVLPDRSKELVPEVYRDLMTDSTSPIYDFYPHDFETDRNGKKYDWEAVVLIPFIDEKRLVDALDRRESRLSAAEKKRNGRGDDIVFSYDKNASSLYKSTMAHLPDIVNCKCVQRVINPHKLDPSKVVYGILPNTKTGISFLAGFPSLHTLDFTFEIEQSGVRVFEQSSRNESVNLNIHSSYADSTVEEIAHRLIGSVVYIDYPFLQEVKVSGVSEGSNLFYAYPSQKSLKIQQTKIEGRDLQSIKREGESIVRNYSHTKAISIEPSDMLIHCHRLEGLNKSTDGNFHKKYSEERIVFPVDLVVENVVEEDERFKEREALPVEDEYPLNSEAILLLNKFYGSRVRVTGYNEGKINLEAYAIREPSTNFPNELAKREFLNTPYYRAGQLSHGFGVSPLFFSQITSRAIFNWGKDKYDIGLVLKKASQNQKALGYSRQNPAGGWEFSDAAAVLFGNYYRTFRAAFKELEAIMAKKNSGGILDIKKILETDGDAAPESLHESLKLMSAWVKEALKSIEFVDISSEAFSNNSIKEIEFWAAEIASKVDYSAPARMANIHRGAIMTFDMAQHQLSQQNFYLGNRVMYALNYGKVAQFARGVVVGVKQIGSSTSVEVIFDKEFDAGSGLDGRVKSKRGILLDSGCLLNCTSKELAYDRAQNNRFNPAVSLPHGGKSNNSRVNGGNKTANGKPKMRDDLAPAGKPQSNAWKNATQVPTRAVQGHKAAAAPPANFVPTPVPAYIPAPTPAAAATPSGSDEGKQLLDLIQGSGNKKPKAQGKEKRVRKNKKSTPPPPAAESGASSQSSHDHTQNAPARKGVVPVGVTPLAALQAELGVTPKPAQKAQPVPMPQPQPHQQPQQVPAMLAQQLANASNKKDSESLLKLLRQ